jgi:hypothetical protein
MNKNIEKPFVAPSVEQMVTYGAEHGISAEDCQEMHRRWEAKRWASRPNWRIQLRHYRRQGWLPSQKEHPAAKEASLPEGIQILETDDIVVAVAVSPEARSELRRRLA